MRDIGGNRNLLSKDTVYKDVVIIGNGPSGISLSYMLAGNWPYWSPEKVQKHPDELLRARLNYYDAQKSIVEHDLFSLADGLEGRSTNPVSLLLDSLQHPCADLGMELPAMVEYKYHPGKEIDHLVLGRGPPGGSWHRMDPNLRTLSLAAWMSLPGLPFAEWEARHPPVLPVDESQQHRYLPTTTADSNTPGMVDSIRILKSNGTGNTRNKKMPLTNSNHSSNRGLTELCDKCSESNKQQQQQQPKVPLTCNKCNSNSNNVNVLQENATNKASTIAYEERNGKVNVKLLYPPRRNLSLRRQLSKEVETRALISRVAEYYESYVDEMGLGKYFMNATIVTTVVSLDGKTLGDNVPEKLRNGRWIVAGFDRNTNKQFSVVCQNLVLANGASDLANRMGVKGEGLQMPWVKYELPHLERALEKYNDDAREQMKPVLIVGAGLSAADAVTICRSSGIPVVHVYRNRTAGLDKMLPGNVYPEYHEVHKMMKDSNQKHELYTPLPEHTIADLSQSGYGANGIHRVTVQHLKTGERRELEVSYCAILIGSRPDLRFISSITTAPKCAPLVSDVSLPIYESDDESDKCLTRQLQPMAIWSFTEQLLFSRFSRKLFWFKNICAKCRHMNLSERVRYKHYQQQQQQPAILESRCQKDCQCVERDTNDVEPAVNNNNNNNNQTQSAVGMGLGEDPNKPIDCKSNPIDVDKYTNAVLRSPQKGLYAMGPLVGDNFVRFIPGGALSITSALHKRTEND